MIMEVDKLNFYELKWDFERDDIYEVRYLDDTAEVSVWYFDISNISAPAMTVI